jgi:hypothetical protein
MNTTPGARIKTANPKQNLRRRRIFFSIAVLVVLGVAALIVVPRLNLGGARGGAGKAANPAPMEAAPRWPPRKP